MIEKKLICIVCPKGCQLTVSKNDNDDYEVSGNFCKRGIMYGINEVINPVRRVTSTVKIENAILPRLPVITDKDVSKDIIFDVMKEINKVSVIAPIRYKDVIIKNILNTDVNIIASRSMD